VDSKFGSHFKIVVAQEADLPLVLPLFLKYLEFYDKPRDRFSSAEPFLRARMRCFESVIFLALAEESLESGERRKIPLGFIQFYPLFSSTRMQRIWLLNDLYVEEVARKLGVATALMNTAEQFGRDTNAVEIQLETSHDNFTAQALYKKKGYKNNDSYLHLKMHL